MADTLNKTTNNHLASGHRIGIVGGGQLAKMTALPAMELGCEIVILEKHKTRLHRVWLPIFYMATGMIPPTC